MANQKISDMTSATTPLGGTELVEIIQGGTNKKTTAQDIADLGGGGGAWGSITGTLSDQTDLQTALNSKQAANSNLTIVAAIGTANQMLRVNAGATALEYFTPTTNPMTTTGDMIYSSDNSGTPARVGIGTANQIMRTNAGATAPEWFSPVLSLTTLGSANQVLGVNNAGTASEYKTISTSTTAVANDVGVTLTGANAIVINIPSATGSVRGVVTTANQTFAGDKTFTGFVLATTGILTASTTDANYVAIGGNVLSTSFAPVNGRFSGVTNVQYRNGMFSTGSTVLTAGASAANFIFGRAPATEGTSGTHDYFVNVAILAPVLTNGTAATTNAYTVYIEGEVTGTATPTNTGALIVASGKTGLGLTTPTATLDLAAGTTSLASMRMRSGVAPSSPNDGDHWYETTNTRLMFRQNATSIELIGTSSVNSVSATAPNRTLTVVLGGTTYYIHAKTTND